MGYIAEWDGYHQTEDLTEEAEEVPEEFQRLVPAYKKSSAEKDYLTSERETAGLLQLLWGERELQEF